MLAGTSKGMCATQIKKLYSIYTYKFIELNKLRSVVNDNTVNDVMETRSKSDRFLRKIYQNIRLKRLRNQFHKQLRSDAEKQFLIPRLPYLSLTETYIRIQNKLHENLFGFLGHEAEF